MIPRSAIVFLLGLLLSAAWACSRAGEEFVRRMWTVEQGLPQNRVTALAQTPDGYLWIGTLSGLARFDGIRFKLHNSYNTPALGNDCINALALGADGTLWIGTPDGLVCLRQGAWRRFTTRDGLPNRGVWDLAIDKAGALWLACGDQVGKFPDGKFAPLKSKAGQELPGRRLLLASSPDDLWALGPGGFTALSADAPRSMDLPELISGDYARAAAWAGDGACWLASWRGLWRKPAGKDWALIQTNAWGDTVDLFLRDRQGNLWAGLREGGLRRFTADKAGCVVLDPSRPGLRVHALFEDREGSIWAGSSAGLFQLRRRTVECFTKANGLPADEVWSVTEGPDGAIWMATSAGPGRLNPTGVPPDLAPYVRAGTRCILAAKTGQIWANSEHGVIPLGLAMEVNTDRRSVEALFLDRRNRLWVGTSSGPIVIENFSKEPCTNLPAADIRFILEDREGAMWFGSKGEGLFRWKEGCLENFRTGQGLADNFVIAIHEDAEGLLWIGTANGLNRLIPARRNRKEGWFTFNTSHGLPDNLINHILEDEQGFLWCSMNREIMRVGRADLNALCSGAASAVACAFVGAADGMASSETNGEHQPAGCKASDGRLWFPTTDGVVAINPADFSRDELPAEAALEEVRIDDQILPIELLDSSAARLAPLGLKPGRARVVEIHYRAKSLVVPDKMRFKYRLRGYEQDWREGSPGERVAFYTNLRPGSYEFQVRVCNHHGLWSGEKAFFAFTVTPYFTETGWFLSLCALLLLAASGAFALWRLRWQRRILRAEQRASLEQERARIARDLHDHLGSALTGLALDAAVSRQAANEASAVALDRLASSSRALAGQMREVVWAINPRCDNLDNLSDFFGQYADHLLGAAGMRCRFDLPVEATSRSIRAESRHQLFTAFKEALNNALRHSGATEVTIRIDHRQATLLVEVADNGRGFTLFQSNRGGEGLRNMRERLAGLGGETAILSVLGSGTTVTFRVPFVEPDSAVNV